MKGAVAKPQKGERYPLFFGYRDELLSKNIPDAFGTYLAYSVIADWRFVRMGTDSYGDGLFKIKPIFEFF